MTHRYDLPFEKDSTSRFVPWILSLMVFLSLLSLTIGLGLRNITQEWQHALTGKITIEIPYNSNVDQELDERVSAIIDTLHTVPEIQSVEIIGSQETQRLLEPFLGTDLPLEDLPLPQLIAIELNSLDALDLQQLQVQLEQAAGTVKIDDHGYWMKDIQNLSKTIEHLCLFIILLIFGISTIVVVYATHMGLAIHFNVIELLHIMGAPDKYIAQQFQRHMTMTSLKGSLIGALGMLLCLGLLFVVSGTAENAFIPSFSLTLPQLLGLTIIPLILIALTSFSARLTVVKALRKIA